MSRLILFSGGVESTALLSFYNPGDVVMIVEDRAEHRTFDIDAVNNILNTLSIFNVEWCYMHAGYYHEKTLYQLWSLMACASVYCARHRDVTEVWYGLHMGEPHVPSARVEHVTIIQAWKVLFPTVRFYSPLIHLSKSEQWDLIPDHLKKLVRNCSFPGKNCGKCSKCKELQELPGSFWCT